LAALIGAYFSDIGRQREGFLPIFQGRVGTRPGETVRLRGRDCMVPVGLRPGRGCIVCRLGKAFTGTKAKREQFCILWEERDPVIYRCMLALLAVTDKDDLVFPINGDQYNRRMQKAQMFFFGHEPDMHLTPHSWRAAFVVDGILDGRPASELRSEGRWVSESSFKVYLDVVGALAVQTHAATRASLPAQEGALAELGSRFAAFPPSPNFRPAALQL
jgi:hypothetical protein